eukprot:scaffold12220_cov21-Tisochrysis_lutea.AAC.1
MSYAEATHCGLISACTPQSAGRLLPTHAGILQNSSRLSAFYGHSAFLLSASMLQTNNRACWGTLGSLDKHTRTESKHCSGRAVSNGLHPG